MTSTSSNKIPVKNLYYLLSYAWSEKLNTRAPEKIDIEECDDLGEFFAQVLSMRLQPLLRRGLDRSYIKQNELTSQPRGRIDFTASVKQQTWKRAQMHCTYDELSADTPLNQILKATLSLLYKSKQKTAIKHKLREQLDYFETVSKTRISSRLFKRIQLHRNNNKYSFVLHLCELIYNSLLPEPDKDGNRKFKSLETNDREMARIFEKFVYTFASRHLNKVELPTRRIYWLAEYHSKSKDLMPTMNTDVMVRWKESGRALILDCKYYKSAFTSQNFHEKEYTRFKTDNLYQVFAYLINKRETPGWENVEGMLLYPTTTINDIREDMTLLGQHRMQICSINLNQPWKNIEKDLLDILTN